MRSRALAAVGTAVLAVGLAAGCGGSSPSGSAQPPANASTPAVNPNGPEVNPAGDIPDNQAFVAYSPPGAGYSIKVPEGWARTTTSSATSFTDKLNSIRLESRAATAAPTVASATASDVPAIAKSVAGYRAGTVTSVSRSAGAGVRITYLAAAPKDAVTGKSRTDAVERYIFFHNGRDAVITLSGPQGADNVDPWMIVTDSLAWTR